VDRCTITTHEQRPGVNFFCQILSSRKTGVRETSQTASSTMLVPLLSYESKTSGRLVMWIVAPTTHEQRPAWIFCQILSPRKLAVRETSKQQKFNNTRAMESNDSRAAPRREFFGNFCCRGEVRGRPTWKSQSSTTQVAISFRREVSGAWNSKRWTLNTSDLKRRFADTMDKHITNVIDEAVRQNSNFDKRRLILIILSSRCASVVRWAVPQTAKVRQRTCHYCPTRAKQLGDFWIVTPTTHKQRPGVIFCQILSSRKLAVRVTSKQQNLNNSCAIIILREKNIWVTCGSLRQHFRREFFSKFCCRGEVSGTWKSQQCTCRYCASPAKKMGDLLSISKLAVRETAKRPQFNNERAVIVLAEQNSWTTCGPLRQRFWRLSMWIFLANFAAVVRWAVREKSKVQQRRCYYLPVVT